MRGLWPRTAVAAEAAFAATPKPYFLIDLEGDASPRTRG
jgi:hypothetical protein